MLHCCSRSCSGSGRGALATGRRELSRRCAAAAVDERAAGQRSSGWSKPDAQEKSVIKTNAMVKCLKSGWRRDAAGAAVENCPKNSRPRSRGHLAKGDGTRSAAISVDNHGGRVLVPPVRTAAISRRTQFDSGTGWPVVLPTRLTRPPAADQDRSYRDGADGKFSHGAAHCGHVCSTTTKPTGQRLNSVSVTFVNKGPGEPAGKQKP